MKRIETVTWETLPEKPNCIRKKRLRKVSEVFFELEAALKDAGLYPDDYFMLDREFADENKDCPEFSDVICYAQWGGSEGIYLEVDIVYLNEATKVYERKNFATGKTLKEDSDSFDRMQYIAGYIYKLFMGERQISARYALVGKKEPEPRTKLMDRIKREYRDYIKNVFVHKPSDLFENGTEIGLCSLVLHNLQKCELSEDKVDELLSSDNALELLTKICRHILEADSFEIQDTIVACISFEQELKNQEKYLSDARDVVVDEKNHTLLCPKCQAYIAEASALKNIDESVPKFCTNCGQKLHYK